VAAQARDERFLRGHRGLQARPREAGTKAVGSNSKAPAMTGVYRTVTCIGEQTGGVEGTPPIAEFAAAITILMAWGPPSGGPGPAKAGPYDSSAGTWPASSAPSSDGEKWTPV